MQKSKDKFFHALLKAASRGFQDRLKDLKEFQVRDILLSRIHAHLTKYSRIIFSLCALSVIIAVIDIETSYARNNILCLKILNGTSMSCRLEQFTYKDIRKTCPRILFFTSFLKLSLAIISIFMNYALYQYYTGELRVMRIKRYLIRGQTGVLTSPMAVLFILECILCTIHMPPGFDASFRPEWQLIPMIRLYQVIKLLKEHNELRYHRLTNVLSSLVKITFEDTFLIKTHFLKHPAQVLLAIYFFCVFGLGYVVFVFERANMSGTLKLENMVWLVVVSITNLGFGDVVPMSPGGRIFVGIASILGTLLTALMIGVMRDWLEIPPNERRILAAIKRQRFHRLKMEAAARKVIIILSIDYLFYNQ
ncbi:unnamed protein product [Oikopleura dioica]|uniref:Potassium channel domain-containing protein n=1 Tax=Oikopleura dioica TaxID=34765 RepID=E4X3C0_OIKDI|nr:unnamed protein product [Oikopleura dioica]